MELYCREGRLVAGPGGSGRFTTDQDGLAGGLSGLEGCVGGREEVQICLVQGGRSRR